VRSVPVPLILGTVLYLVAGGCAGFNLDEVMPPQAAAPRPPEGKRLAELVNAAFTTAKLTGAPEVSTVRAAHDSQWGDWTFCIKSSADQSPRYAVLIGHDAILEVRSSVLIDGCDKESYHPFATKDQNGKSDGSHGHRQ
jgi:hypothetical protein